MLIWVSCPSNLNWMLCSFSSRTASWPETMEHKINLLHFSTERTWIMLCFPKCHFWHRRMNLIWRLAIHFSSSRFPMLINADVVNSTLVIRLSCLHCIAQCESSTCSLKLIDDAFQLIVSSFIATHYLVERSQQGFTRTWSDRLSSKSASRAEATSWNVHVSKSGKLNKVEGVVDLKWSFLGHRQVLQLVPFLCTIEFPLQSRFNCALCIEVCIIDTDWKSNWHRHDSLLLCKNCRSRATLLSESSNRWDWTVSDADKFIRLTNFIYLPANSIIFSAHLH